jgi:hypothetical protein
MVLAQPTCRSPWPAFPCVIACFLAIARSYIWI